ncbi:MAG: polysaccharide biosynthesis tyrosine autokinase [Verrucomicrobiota bacterium]|nr:polysaccharide biosynthesis tyrosine autokinase [Verrucomicrobiota bacterium]
MDIKTENNQEEIHLLDYWHIISIRLPLFILLFLLVVIAVGIYTYTKVPIYVAKTHLVIEPTSSKITGMSEAYNPMENNIARQNFVATQMELILAKHLLTDVFKHFNFATKEEFINSTEPIKAFKGLFDVTSKRATFIVILSFKWKDPKLAANVVNYLTHIYIKNYKNRSLRFSGSGIENLKQQLEGIREKRKEALEALISFKEKNQIIDLDDAHKLLVDRMTKLNEALMDAQVKAETAKTTVQGIKVWEKEGGNVNYIPELMQNRTLANFKLEGLRQKSEAIELLEKYGKNHSLVKNQHKIIEAIDKAIDTEISYTIGASEVEYKKARLLVEVMGEGFKELKQEAFKIDSLSGKYRILKDMYDASEKSYQKIINRINELTITKGAGDIDATANIRISDSALPPQKFTYPKKKRNMAIAIILGLILAGALCFALDYMDTTLKTKDDIETLLKLPVLGFMPRLKQTDNELETLDFPQSSFSEAFRTIRTSIRLSVIGKKAKAFLLTSSAPSAGKTIAATNLAISFAKDGKKVLLMECDMRRPRLKKLLKTIPEDKLTSGLSNVIVGNKKLDDITWQHPDIKNLSVALCGPRPPNPAELLGTDEFKEILAEAKNKFDLVIIDAPPILNVTDSSILIGLGLPLVFLVRAFKTDKHLALNAVSQINSIQGDVLGVILNNSDATSKTKYGYYYKYDYEYN